MTMQPMQWFADPELRRVHLIKDIRKRVIDTHPEIGFCTACAPNDCTRVNTDNGVCHCCAASACSEESGLRNVNTPGMCRPCDIVINRVGQGRSEEAVRHYLRPLMKLFPHANNKVIEKCLNITIGNATTDVDVVMQIQVSLRRAPGGCLLFKKFTKPVEQLLRVRTFHRVRTLHRVRILHRVTVLHRVTALHRTERYYSEPQYCTELRCITLSHSIAQSQSIAQSHSIAQS